MKKNKITAIAIIMAFCINFTILPALSIVDNSSDIKHGKINVYETVNMEKWNNKNDIYLQDYILRALNNNKDIKIAALKIEEAKNNVTLVKSNQLPTLSIGASPSVTKFPSSEKTEGSIAIPMYASYELDLFGKNWDKTKSARKIMESTAYEAQTADISIVSMVAAVYYNIVNLDKIIEIQEKLTKNREQIYKLNKSANKEGVVSTSDLSLSEKSFILAQNDLIQYKKSRQNAINALSVLLGETSNNSNEYKRIKFDELSDNFNIPDEINSEIITNRPDYKSIEKQLEAAGLNVRAAKKEFLPAFNILGLISFVSTSMASSMNWSNAIALLGGSASLPLFTGFKRSANLKLNKNKYEELLQRYEKTNLTAFQEVNDALYNFKSDKESYDNNKKAYGIQKNDFLLAKSKFEKGVISKLDLLGQEETLLYIEKLLSQAKTDCIIDEITLYKSTGARI